jgi:hypothetical protein
LRETLDVGSQPRRQDVRGHRCLEPAVSDEEDNRVKEGMLQFQELGKAPGVPIILSQRILESILGAEQNLCPPLVSFATENPAFHVLGLDDKDPKG